MAFLLGSFPVFPERNHPKKGGPLPGAGSKPMPSPERNHQLDGKKKGVILLRTRFETPKLTHLAGSAAASARGQPGRARSGAPGARTWDAKGPGTGKKRQLTRPNELEANLSRQNPRYAWGTPFFHNSSKQWVRDKNHPY